MSKILGKNIKIKEVSTVYVKSFSKVFACDIVETIGENLLPERRRDMIREEMTSSISIGI